MQCLCIRAHTWVDSWRNFHSWLWCLLVIIAFYLAAHFNHLELFSIQSHRQPDYHPLFCTAYLELSLQTKQAAEDAENSQADTCSRVRGMPSPAHLTVSRPLPPPTAYKTDGLPGLMSLWMTKHMGSSHKICHVSLPANLTFLSYCILFDNLNSLRVYYQQMVWMTHDYLPQWKYSGTIYTCQCNSPRYLTNDRNECSWQEKRLVVPIFSTFSSFNLTFSSFHLTCIFSASFSTPNQDAFLFFCDQDYFHCAKSVQNQCDSC